MSLAEAPSGDVGSPFTVVADAEPSLPCLLEVAAERCVAALLAEQWACGGMIDGFRRHGFAAVPDQVAAAARAARILGERWVADTCSFGDVTLGMHRLTLLLIEMEALPDPDRRRLHGGRALLAPVSGDQHGFGLATVALALRRAGWDVAVDLSEDADAVVAAARRGVEVVGLSIGHDRAIATATKLVARLRALSRPPTIAVGGPMLHRVPDLARAVGADLSCFDGFALAEALAPIAQAA